MQIKKIKNSAKALSVACCGVFQRYGFSVFVCNRLSILRLGWLNKEQLPEFEYLRCGHWLLMKHRLPDG